jgi:hypothetical protein
MIAVFFTEQIVSNTKASKLYCKNAKFEFWMGRRFLIESFVLFPILPDKSRDLTIN